MYHRYYDEVSKTGYLSISGALGTAVITSQRLKFYLEKQLIDQYIYQNFPSPLKCQNYGHMEVSSGSEIITNKVYYIPTVCLSEKIGKVLHEKFSFGLHCKQLGLNTTHRLPNTSSVNADEIMTINEYIMSKYSE